MHFSTIATLSVALMAGLGATFTPVSGTSKDSHVILARAAAAGVDVTGPIPKDHVVARDGSIHAKAGSKAALWIRSQFEFESGKSEHAKRQDSPITIGMWTQDDCQGDAVYIQNVVYDYQYSGPGPYVSVQVSGRDMQQGEALDFSSTDAYGNFCGVYQYSAEPNTPQGQWNCDNQPINCFELSAGH